MLSENSVDPDQLASQKPADQYHIVFNFKFTVKPVLRGHSKKIKNCFSRPIIAYCRTKVLQNAPREQVKSIAECFKRAFCNTFDLH